MLYQKWVFQISTDFFSDCPTYYGLTNLMSTEYIYCISDIWYNCIEAILHLVASEPKISYKKKKKNVV